MQKVTAAAAALGRVFMPNLFPDCPELNARARRWLERAWNCATLFLLTVAVIEAGALLWPF